jgi:DinB superfamily
MNRVEIETKLSRDRAWLIETYSGMSANDLTRGVTASEHDPSIPWSALDHLAHLAGIEHEFNRMIRRHLSGDMNPVALVTNKDGSPRDRADIMAAVHNMNEKWVEQHRGKPLGEVVAAGQRARAETLALIAELSDGQLAERLPGAPWSDGTVGGVLAVNADHGRMHYAWVKEGLANPGAG